MSTSTMQNKFIELYESEADAIFRFCLLRLSDREQATDIMQETFARLWQEMEIGKKIANVRAFIFTVAHHLIIDWYRKKKSLSLEGMVNEENGDESFEPSFASINSKIELELEAEGRYLLENINKLAKSYRKAVYLRFVKGLTPPEIGIILKLSANAVSVRINRGLEQLRKITGYSKKNSR